MSKVDACFANAPLSARVYAHEITEHNLLSRSASTSANGRELGKST
jgi:hypothetical protein